MFTKIIVAIISQYMCISNHYILNFTLIHCYCQLYLNKNGKKRVSFVSDCYWHRIFSKKLNDWGWREKNGWEYNKVRLNINSQEFTPWHHVYLSISLSFLIASAVRETVTWFTVSLQKTFCQGKLNFTRNLHPRGIFFHKFLNRILWSEACSVQIECFVVVFLMVNRTQATWKT